MSESNSQPRKHHYLPQFYLRSFSIDRKGVFQIEKATGLSYGCQIKDVAAIRDYHELDGENTDDPNALERTIAQLESEQASHLQEVLIAGITADSHRWNMLQLLAVMRMRVPSVKEHIEQSYGATIRATALALERTGQLPKPPAGYEKHLSVENLDIKVLNWKCLEVMFNMAANEKLLNILLKMRATLYQAPLGTRYFTSDQPVALYHPTLSTSAYGVGPSTNGVEISFPLNSKTLLMLDHVSGQHGERIATPAEVLEFNRRTVVMAQNYIFVGEGHELAESQVLEHSEQFAGFRHDNIDAGSEFVQIHRFIAVGPQ